MNELDKAKSEILDLKADRLKQQSRAPVRGKKSTFDVDKGPASPPMYNL